MHPWLLRFPPVSTYGALIVAALVVAWLWMRRRAARSGIEPSRLDLLVPLVVGAGLLGAWLFGALADRVTGSDDHAAVLVGSLLIATAAGIGYGLVVHVPLGVLGDFCAAPLALGIAMGRVGCFFAGCCFGKVCPIAMPGLSVRFPAGSFAYWEHVHGGLLSGDAAASLPVYPVQLYESAGCLLLAAALGSRRASMVPGRVVAGERFLCLGMGYGLLRFGMEFLRGDNNPVHGLTFSQWAAVGIVALAMVTLILRRRFARMWNLPAPGFHPTATTSPSPSPQPGA